MMRLVLFLCGLTALFDGSKCVQHVCSELFDRGKCACSGDSHTTSTSTQYLHPKVGGHKQFHDVQLFGMKKGSLENMQLDKLIAIKDFDVVATRKPSLTVDNLLHGTAGRTNITLAWRISADINWVNMFLLHVIFNSGSKDEIWKLFLDNSQKTITKQQFEKVKFIYTLNESLTYGNYSISLYIYNEHDVTYSSQSSKKQGGTAYIRINRLPPKEEISDYKSCNSIPIILWRTDVIVLYNNGSDVVDIVFENALPEFNVVTYYVTLDSSHCHGHCSVCNISHVSSSSHSHLRFFNVSPGLYEVSIRAIRNRKGADNYCPWFQEGSHIIPGTRFAVTNEVKELPFSFNWCSSMSCLLPMLIGLIIILTILTTVALVILHWHKRICRKKSPLSFINRDDKIRKPSIPSSLISIIPPDEYTNSMESMSSVQLDRQLLDINTASGRFSRESGIATDSHSRRPLLESLDNNIIVN